MTARGWEDLSQILYLYEEEGLAVDEVLIGQYLRNERVVKEFAAYYDLYRKYQKNYHVEEILNGDAPEEVAARAKAAPFDERLSLLSMLLDIVLGEMRRGVEGADYLNDLMPLLKGLKSLSEKEAAANGNVLADMLERQKEAKKKAADSLRMANALSEGDKRKCRKTIRFLEEAKKELYVGDAGTATEAFSYIKQKFDQQVRSEEHTSELQSPS